MIQLKQTFHIHSKKCQRQFSSYGHYKLSIQGASERGYAGLLKSDISLYESIGALLFLLFLAPGAVYDPSSTISAQPAKWIGRLANHAC